MYCQVISIRSRSLLPVPREIRYLSTNKAPLRIHARKSATALHQSPSQKSLRYEKIPFAQCTGDTRFPRDVRYSTSTTCLDSKVGHHSMYHPLRQSGNSSSSYTSRVIQRYFPSPYYIDSLPCSSLHCSPPYRCSCISESGSRTYMPDYMSNK